MARKKDLKKLLNEGKDARVKRYQTLLQKIEKGKSLTAAELADLGNLEDGLIEDIADKPKGAISRQQAADRCGVSVRVIKYSVSRGLLREEPDGSFLDAELDRWLADRDKKQGFPLAGKGNAITKVKKDAADLRWRNARATREEILIKQLRGTLIGKEELTEEMSKIASVFVNTLTIYEDRLPPKLEGHSKPEMRKIIHNENKALRDALCQKQQKPVKKKPIKKKATPGRKKSKK